jgi:type II secretory ATPase GspE/PulE/Tfp pilus assembly ATPase PilB-like protein
LGIFEMLTVDGAIQESIRAGLDANGIRRTALSRGFRDLRTDGERLVAMGVTTRAELERVTALGVDILDQDGA